MNSRLLYMDNLKGICILLVVFCHYTLLSGSSVVGNAIMTLAWAAVPCFMMITGGLLCRKKSDFDWKKYIKRLITLYVVIILWRIVYILIYIVMNGNIYTGKDIIAGIFFMSDVNGINMDVFWYMKAYLVTYMIYPIIWFLLMNGGKKYMLNIMVVTGVSGIFIPTMNMIVTHYINFSIYDAAYLTPYLNYPYMIFYFVLGAFLLEYREMIHIKIKKNMPIILFVIGFMLLFIVKYKETGSFRWNNIYISNGYNRISTLIMSVGLYLCFDFYCDIKLGLGKLIGQSTMGIYYMHYIILAVFDKYLYSGIGIEYYSTIANSLKTIIITFICIVLTIIIKKIPFIKKMVV